MKNYVSKFIGKMYYFKKNTFESKKNEHKIFFQKKRSI